MAGTHNGRLLNPQQAIQCGFNGRFGPNCFQQMFGEVRHIGLRL